MNTITSMMMPLYIIKRLLIFLLLHTKIRLDMQNVWHLFIKN